MVLAQISDFGPFGQYVPILFLGPKPPQNWIFFKSPIANIQDNKITLLMSPQPPSAHYFLSKYAQISDFEWFWAKMFSEPRPPKNYFFQKKLLPNSRQ